MRLGTFFVSQAGGRLGQARRPGSTFRVRGQLEAKIGEKVPRPDPETAKAEAAFEAYVAATARMLEAMSPRRRR
jgi:hypothetical protein